MPSQTPDEPDPTESDSVVDPDVDLGESAQLVEIKPREWDLLLAVAIGGVLGTLARYGLGLAVPHAAHTFPWSTVLINVSGCFAIGILMAIILSWPEPPRLVRPFFGVGVLGGYTTYSTFATDIVGLGDSDRVGSAAAYLAVTVASCAVAVWLATALTQRILRVNRRPG